MIEAILDLKNGVWTHKHSSSSFFRGKSQEQLLVLLYSFLAIKPVPSLFHAFGKQRIPSSQKLEGVSGAPADQHRHRLPFLSSIS